MPRKNARRQAILEQALQREKAAGSKVYRNKRKGVDITGSGADPRVGAKALREMNAAQLRQHMRSVDRFTDRRNQYTPGYGGAAMPMSRVQLYKQLEATANERAERYWNSVKGITFGGSDSDAATQTLGQRMERVRPADALRAGFYSRTFDSVNRPIESITGSDKLEKYISDMQARLKPGYLREQMAMRRENLEQIANGLSDETLKKIRDLSDDQLNIVADYRNLMEMAGFRYDQEKVGVEDLSPGQRARYDDAERDINGLLDWAAKLPRNDATRRTEYTDTTAKLIPIQFDPNDTRVKSIPIQFDPNDTRVKSIPIQNGKRGKRK